MRCLHDNLVHARHMDDTWMTHEHVTHERQFGSWTTHFTKQRECGQTPTKERDICQLKASGHIFINLPYTNLTYVGLCHHNRLFIYKVFYLANGTPFALDLRSAYLEMLGHMHGRGGSSSGHNQKYRPSLYNIYKNCTTIYGLFIV